MHAGCGEYVARDADWQRPVGRPFGSRLAAGREWYEHIPMQTPLTPLEFSRRARSLYGDREAVVDGDQRWTYIQFLDRCDRWSSALQGLGVAPGDRVGYIAPNTHSHLEGCYGVPQLGAVLVRLQLGRIKKRVAQNHGIPFEYGDDVVELVVSRCTEAESGGRVIDSILTNTVLPRVSLEYLSRLAAGQAMKRIRLTVSDGDFGYDFD